MLADEANPKRAFNASVGELMSELYHYVQCGLDNIYLLDFPSSVESPEILDTDLLHFEIAKAIVLSPCGLRGPELVFLRDDLGLKITQFANICGVSPTTVFRWEESASAVAQQADAFARLVYAAGSSDGDLAREVARMLMRREAVERETAPKSLVFGRSGDGWRQVQ